MPFVISYLDGKNEEKLWDTVALLKYLNQYKTSKSRKTQNLVNEVSLTWKKCSCAGTEAQGLWKNSIQ